MSFPSPTTPGAAAAADATGDIVGSYTEPVSGHHLVLARPQSRPELWEAYLAGARHNYRLHGVESAIEYTTVRDGRSTSLFVVALDEGRVVGGLRVQGRLTRADQAHALREWAGRPGSLEMHHQIAQRLPSGVVEIKAVWVDHDAHHRTALTAALARAFVHAMDVLQVRYALCTAAAHAVTRWQTSGGVVAADVPAVAYPDERYRTLMMWWDRTRVDDQVSADQLAFLTSESDQLFGRAPGIADLPSVA